MRKVWTLFYLFFLFVLSISRAFASDNFSTSYNVSYQVGDSGTTHVLFGITLTNKTSQYYASSYKIQLGFSHLQNIKASDGNGSIVPTVFNDKSGSTINIPFNQRIVGKDNSIKFNLSFDTDDIVQRQGSIWEVNIPGISNQNDFSDFKAHVSVPNFLGKPTYIKPAQANNSLDFTRDQLGTSGISIAFGEKQNYEFNLSYHLRNPNIFPIRTEIALPPDTNYQNIEISSITPKPVNVVLDKDNNWLAKYDLPPSSQKDIFVKGKVQIALYPAKTEETEESLKKYLVSQKYWETDSPKISQLAKTLKNASAIYDYVTNHLTYDFSRISNGKKRLGALALLDNSNSAVCLEFTDLFIALARASGIPAREVDGYAYTQNSAQRPLSQVLDVLHSWPEYYDRTKRTWVMVDPTWGATTGGIDYFATLDFDHFAFVIKGIDSTYPIPAGGYKYAGKEGSKDVDVGFTDIFDQTAPTIQVSTLKIPNSTFAGFPLKGTIEFNNSGSSAYPAQSILIDSTLQPFSKQIELSLIPPYGSLDVPVDYQTGGFLTNKKATITIHVGENGIDKEVEVSSIFFTTFGLIGGILLAIFIITISVITRKARRVQVS